MGALVQCWHNDYGPFRVYNISKWSKILLDWIFATADVEGPMTPFASGPQFVKRATATPCFPLSSRRYCLIASVSNLRLHLGVMQLPSIHTFFILHTLVWSQKEAEWIEESSQRVSRFIHWCCRSFVNQGWKISEKREDQSFISLRPVQKCVHFKFYPCTVWLLLTWKVCKCAKIWFKSTSDCQLPSLVRPLGLNQAGASSTLIPMSRASVQTEIITFS